MVCRVQFAFLCLGLVFAPCSATSVSPIEKVLQLMDGLSAKITAEGEAEAQAFKEYMEWCDDTKTETGFEIKTATKDIEELEATVTKTTSDIEAATTAIEELGDAIAKNDADLKAATEVREKEHADFAAVEADLVDTVDTLSRAIGILEKEMSKNPALLQQNQANSAGLQAFVSSLGAIIDAAGMNVNDKSKLLALVQDRSSDEDEDSELGAPAGNKYETHSTNILDVLADLKDKANVELSDARKAEMVSKHDFEMLKQGLEDELAADNKELSKTKSSKAASEEAKATAEGDLAQTQKDLAQAEKKLEMTTEDCAQVAAANEASIKSRAEELKAVATAKQIIVESTGGAADHQYSFIQTARSQARMRGSLEVVNMVKNLAKNMHSAALAQLASRIGAVARYGAGAGEDPFAKITGLIGDMIATLEKEAAEEASKKAYCDEEMGKTKAKKDELNSDIDSLTAKIDKATATSTKLKGQVAELQKELAAISKQQAEMDKARTDEHAAFVKAEADLKQGIEGVGKALEVLREYYGKGAALVQSGMDSMMQQPAKPTVHSADGGAGGGIIGMLEVCESDFSKSLAEETVKEDEAAAEYEKVTQENKIAKTTKEQDVKYKTSEAKGLDKAIAEHTSDKDALSEELTAVLEYKDKLDKQCTYAPDSYEERKKRREAEIAGLKEALKYLEGAAFTQKSSRLHR